MKLLSIKIQGNASWWWCGTFVASWGEWWWHGSIQVLKWKLNSCDGGSRQALVYQPASINWDGFEVKPNVLPMLKLIIHTVRYCEEIEKEIPIHHLLYLEFLKLISNVTFHTIFFWKFFFIDVTANQKTFLFQYYFTMLRWK